ncbi:MAG: hypothetical protein EOP51_34875 [Sphingobacteriales bacterium]|nr:MAG: hypothetical protein EOP51_34875 [Sphingobacteriales bacterium]
MGATLALAGKKVVMLEFDLRKPKLLSDMGLSARAGITNYLVSNDIDVNDITMPVPDFPNLFVIGCGDSPPNPSELILGDKMNDLFARLNEEYDHVIIDSPPVGLIADAYNLARFADRTLYIIRYNYTLKEQLNVIKDIKEKGSLKNLMLILNDARKENMQGYGNYGYGYHYGYGYVNEEEEMPWLQRIFKKRSR